MFSFFRRKKQAVPATAPPALPEVPKAEAARPPVEASAPASPALPESGSESAETVALRARSSEDLCGLTPGMEREEIHALLARLFRRHNRAASSLDEQLRTEAEIMLRAIVDIRLRYLENRDFSAEGGPQPGERA